MSGFPGRSSLCSRNLKPNPCSIDLTMSSGLVSRGLTLDIIRLRRVSLCSSISCKSSPIKHAPQQGWKTRWMRKSRTPYQWLRIYNLTAQGTVC